MYDTTKPYKKQVLELIKETWETPYVSVREGVYPIIEKKFSGFEVDHTDGIGTKGIYHWQKRTFRNAVLDALAMNLNDLALIHAAPYKLQNHIVIPRDDTQAILEIIKALSDECVKRKIAITGGETSIHSGTEGLDISITITGFAKEERKNEFRVGDALVGIKSNGLHSNGFTKVRELFGKEFRPEFVEPTTIYWDMIADLGEKFDIHGMTHVTGGAFTKLKLILPDGADVFIRQEGVLEPHEIFREIYTRGVSDEEMYKMFNCGVGFVFSCERSDAEKILETITEAALLGEVARGTGKVKIHSVFSGKSIEF